MTELERELLAALRAVVPYAEAEAESLDGAADKDDDEELDLEAEQAWDAVEAAQVLIARIDAMVPA
jgi:hypothetical protein